MGNLYVNLGKNFNVRFKGQENCKVQDRIIFDFFDRNDMIVRIPIIRENNVIFYLVKPVDPVKKPTLQFS